MLAVRATAVRPEYNNFLRPLSMSTDATGNMDAAGNKDAGYMTDIKLWEPPFALLLSEQDEVWMQEALTPEHLLCRCLPKRVKKSSNCLQVQ